MMLAKLQTRKTQAKKERGAMPRYIDTPASSLGGGGGGVVVASSARLLIVGIGRPSVMAPLIQTISSSRINVEIFDSRSVSVGIAPALPAIFFLRISCSFFYIGAFHLQFVVQVLPFPLVLTGITSAAIAFL